MSKAELVDAIAKASRGEAVRGGNSEMRILNRKSQLRAPAGHRSATRSTSRAGSRQLAGRRLGQGLEGGAAHRRRPGRVSQRGVPESLRSGAAGKGPDTIRRARERGGPRSRVVVADRGRRLSDGALVEASILARLVGIRLLTLDATIVIVPADTTAPTTEARRWSAVTPVRSSRVAPGRSPAVGSGLADVVRSINEGAELLADARRNGS